MVCACLPVIGPQAYRYLKHAVNGTINDDDYYHRYPSGLTRQLASWHSTPDGFQRFGSENHIIIPTDPSSNGGGSDSAGGRRSSISKARDHGLVPLQTVVVAGKSDSDSGSGKPYDRDPGEQRSPGLRDPDWIGQPSPTSPGIHVRTEVQVVHSDA